MQPVSNCCSLTAGSSRQAVGREAPYNQVADDNLQDLGLGARAPSEDLLQDANEQMAQRSADKHSVEGHLGHAGAEVVAVLADIMRNPRGEQLLQGQKDARCEHLGAQRVRLQLSEMDLPLCQKKRLIKHGKEGHTARYPVVVFPPVKRSPTLCATSSVFFSATRTTSCCTLTTDMLDGCLRKRSGSRGASAARAKLEVNGCEKRLSSKSAACLFLSESVQSLRGLGIFEGLRCRRETVGKGGAVCLCLAQARGGGVPRQITGRMAVASGGRARTTPAANARGGEGGFEWVHSPDGKNVVRRKCAMQGGSGG